MHEERISLGVTDYLFTSGQENCVLKDYQDIGSDCMTDIHSIAGLHVVFPSHSAMKPLTSSGASQ